MNTWIQSRLYRGSSNDRIEELRVYRTLRDWLDLDYRLLAEIFQGEEHALFLLKTMQQASCQLQMLLDKKIWTIERNEQPNKTVEMLWHDTKFTTKAVMSMGAPTSDGSIPSNTPPSIPPPAPRVSSPAHMRNSEKSSWGFRKVDIIDGCDSIDERKKALEVLLQRRLWIKDEKIQVQWKNVKSSHLLQDCDLRDTRFFGIEKNGEALAFHGADLRDAVFEGKCYDADFRNANLCNANLTALWHWDIRLSTRTLSGASALVRTRLSRQFLENGFTLDGQWYRPGPVYPGQNGRSIDEGIRALRAAGAEIVW